MIIETLTWKVCQSSGEKPMTSYSSIDLHFNEILEIVRRSSFLHQENLYIYGGDSIRVDRKYIKDIFKLNLSQESWSKQAFVKFSTRLFFRLSDLDKA